MNERECPSTKAQTTDVTKEINALLKHPHYEGNDDALNELYKDVEFHDDVTGKKLHHGMAVEARRLEMAFFRRLRVYDKVPIQEAHDNGCKIITTRWLDINKGDAESPNYRARLVGRELALDNRLDLFAATPPLEALRILCSMRASNQNRMRPYRIPSIDVKRAYFHAKSQRPVYIKIPAEDFEPGDEGRVGRLNLGLYGTRDAAQNWAKEYTNTLRTLGFNVGKATPCSFKHCERELFITVHGDDFTVTGPEEDLRWLETKFSDKYEIKASMLGPDNGMEAEIRVLNRILRWTDEGIEYEPDQRHAELVIREAGMTGARAVSMPGMADTWIGQIYNSRQKKYPNTWPSHGSTTGPE